MTFIRVMSAEIVAELHRAVIQNDMKRLELCKRCLGRHLTAIVFHALSDLSTLTKTDIFHYGAT